MCAEHKTGGEGHAQGWKAHVYATTAFEHEQGLLWKRPFTRCYLFPTSQQRIHSNTSQPVRATHLQLRFDRSLPGTALPLLPPCPRSQRPRVLQVICQRRELRLRLRPIILGCSKYARCRTSADEHEHTTAQAVAALNTEPSSYSMKARGDRILFAPSHNGMHVLAESFECLQVRRQTDRSKHFLLGTWCCRCSLGDSDHVHMVGVHACTMSSSESLICCLRSRICAAKPSTCA